VAHDAGRPQQHALAVMLASASGCDACMAAPCSWHADENEDEAAASHGGRSSPPWGACALRRAGNVRKPVGGRAGRRARLELRERGRVLRAQEALRRGGAGVVDEDDDGEVAGVRRRPGRDLAQAALEQVAAGREVPVRQPQHLHGAAAAPRLERTGAHVGEICALSVCSSPVRQAPVECIDQRSMRVFHGSSHADLDMPLAAASDVHCSWRAAYARARSAPDRAAPARAPATCERQARCGRAP
jgi:hypothetical protein